MIPMCCCPFCRRSMRGQFTIDQVQDDLQMLFDKQYILTETVD